jgi:PLP dependent protein
MTIAENLKQIKAKAGNATLVAVSKKQPPEKIVEALAAGQRVFGENRVQEAQERWNDLRKEYTDLKLHLIGKLQTNKAADAVALFDVIETVDREKLAKALSEEMRKQNKKIPCFIQVNTGDENQKAGIDIMALPAFIKFCREECGLDIRGLMCIPPVDEPPALHFALLAKLAQENNLRDLSMGMSADFEKAIPLGATFIRVGTGAFGEREA